MSHIIDISASSSLYFSQIASSRSTLSFQHLLQYLKTFTNLTQHFKSFHTKGEKCQIILEINFQKHLPSVVQRIVIDKRRMTYQSKFILSKGSQIVACETKCLRLMIIKELQQLKKKMRIYSFSFSIDQSSGEIIGKNILTLTQQTNIYQLLLFQITALQNNLSRFLTISLTNINFLPALFTEFMHQKYKNINEVNVEDRIQKRIYKYFHFSIIELWRSYSKAPSESLEEPDDKLLQEQLENEVPTGFNQQSSEIYIYRSISKFMTPHKFQISSEQNSNIQIHLKIPMIQAKRSQSNFVFSQIKVLDESSDTIDTGLRGASNKILLSKLKFAYINSISSSNENNNRAPPVKQYTKLVAIKTPLQKHTERQRKRNQHEIKILRIFSEAESPFLLRYFYTLSPNFKCSNMLMMSFVSNCETYGSFISKKRNILSFSSKVYLLINVLQALRLIKDYNVVHMDISPSNILVNSNYITQLIDFGQSYHQKLCGKDYNPGYTLPFSFPEKFSAKEFTNKSDMFSFGVLTFYSIFRSLPYNPTQKLVDSLKKFTYSNKFYFAPESVQYYGYKKLIIFLFTYIQRCLNPDPILRPHPAWSIILFKQLYFWLQQVSMMS